MPSRSDDPTRKASDEDVPTEGLPETGQAPAVPQEPGTEAEGMDATETAQTTQEAPILEEVPVVADEPPVAPMYAFDTKPRSDVYTLMLMFAFMAFVASSAFAIIEGRDFYDCEFFVFGKETERERIERERQEALEAAAEAPATEAPKESPKEEPK